MWTPIIGRGMTLPQLQDFIDAMKFDKWRPQFMVAHNTAVPSLKQWHQVSGETRMRNLEHYFKNQRGWPSAPHAFVADDLVWPFTPFNVPGTHTPSWNWNSIGIEMVADFQTEDDDSGQGLKVKLNTVALFGMLHRKLGLDPETIRLHREDPRTDHRCPGDDFNKWEFIALVKEWVNHGGDFQGGPIIPIEEPTAPQRTGTVVVPDWLNIRGFSSASAPILGRLNNGDRITITGEEMNGPTKWFRIQQGWVAARYVKENP